jgi:hypothetical protein
MNPKDLEDLEESTDAEEVDSQPEIIEKKKDKKPRTQKQIDAFEKVRQIRDGKRVERKETREKTNAELKILKEEKITKKALSIKKKQILRDADLDAISDEDIPVEVIKHIMKKYPKKNVAIKPSARPATTTSQEPITSTLVFI